MAYTADSLAKALKETWTEDSFKKAFDLEIQGSTMDILDLARRQNIYYGDSRSRALHELKARQNQTMQLLAAKQRKGKSSYRQRQKNGRAGRKK